MAQVSAPQVVAEDIREVLRVSPQYLAVLDRLADAIELGEGYVIITLDPDGLKIQPIATPSVNTTVQLRSQARIISKSAWALGNVRFVATVPDGGADLLPSAEMPPDPGLTPNIEPQ